MGTAEVDLDHNAVPGGLVAVDPATREERVLVEDLDDVSYAKKPRPRKKRLEETWPDLVAVHLATGPDPP
jgi:hypothetical protein